METEEKEKDVGSPSISQSAEGFNEADWEEHTSEQPTSNEQDVLAPINALEGELQMLKKAAKEAQCEDDSVNGGDVFSGVTTFFIMAPAS